MEFIEIVENEINASDVIDKVFSESCGAVAVFIGTVRDTGRGRKVVALENEAYAPMVIEELGNICREAGEQFDTGRIAVTHRIGRMKPGEIIVVTAVASAHRDKAYDASRYLIEELKVRLPIWKKEYFEDGETWVEGAKAPGG